MTMSGQKAREFLMTLVDEEGFTEAAEIAVHVHDSVWIDSETSEALRIDVRTLHEAYSKRTGETKMYELGRLLYILQIAMWVNSLK